MKFFFYLLITCFTPSVLLAQSNILDKESQGGLVSYAKKSKKHLISEDKKISSEDIKTLYERGYPEIWSSEKNELKFIGMPIGGIGCGQLYMGGNGNLWVWDIFKSNYSREQDWAYFASMTMNGHYTEPIPQGNRYHHSMGAEVEQGFAIKINNNAIYTLDETSFDDINFRGEYPMAKVSYNDPTCPVEVSLEAYSPFIPLNIKESALPTVIMSYTIENKDSKSVDIDLVGWLENKVCPYNDTIIGYKRLNRVVESANAITLNEELVNRGSEVSDLSTSHLGYGSMALTLLKSEAYDANGNSLFDLDYLSNGEWSEDNKSTQEVDFTEPLIGSLSTGNVSLKPGEKLKCTFVLSWYFPYYPALENSNYGEMGAITDFAKLKRNYSKYFNSANEVSDYVVDKIDYLAGETSLWNETWYDSSLPYWLLDRSFLTINTLSTQTTHFFDNNRLWAWEGVEACGGSCQHVYNYAQSVARIFPELERNQREFIDLGLGFNKATGESYNRAEMEQKHLSDAQTGMIMRVWREHTISKDPLFLNRVWPNVKLAMDFMISEDGDDNGILEGIQSNTLDAAWIGPISWISSIYCGALAACEQMAIEMGDNEYAQKCRKILDKGTENLTTDLYNGEYFFNTPPEPSNNINSNTGCLIDQILGQSWANQYGLPAIIPAEKAKSALNALWKHNFTSDVWLYDHMHSPIKNTRVYATRGEAGLVMCTWPYDSGANVAVPGFKDLDEFKIKWAIDPGGYFDEVWTGQEYQVASHMLSEGEAIKLNDDLNIDDLDNSLTLKGLAVAKAVHNRYSPEKRNPYNEVECSDHYARAMASYGVFLSACGFEYHGPKGEIGFTPKIHPEQFRAPFTVAEGWGTFTQDIKSRKQKHSLELKYGTMQLNRWNIQLADNEDIKTAKLLLNGNKQKAELKQCEDGVYYWTLKNLSLEKGDCLSSSIEIN